MPAPSVRAAAARSSGIRRRGSATAKRNGSFADTTLPELLALALDRELSATLSLVEEDGTEHKVQLHRGLPAKVKTGVPVAPLDATLRLMGSPLDYVFLRTVPLATDGPELHGAILVREGHLDEATLFRALRAQVTLKMCYLLKLGPGTRYNFSPDTSLLQDYGGPELVPAPPLALIAQGCRAQGADSRARERLSRYVGVRLSLHPYANIEALQLREEEARVVEVLRSHPSSSSTLLAAHVADDETVIVVLSLLLITRALDLGDDPPIGYGMNEPPPVIRRTMPASARAASPSRTQAVPPLVLNARAVAQRALTIAHEDYFSALGVSESAPLAAIERGFHTAMFLWHPDRLPPSLADQRDTAGKICAYLNRAYQTLRDPDKRRLYEAGRRPKPTPVVETETATAVSASELFEQGRVALRERDLPRAERCLGAALAADPELLGATLLLAWVQAERLGPVPNLERGETSDLYAQQLRSIDTVLRHDPRFVEARFYRGQLLKRSGYVSEALRDFQAVLKLQPRHVDAAREIRLYTMRETKRRAEKGMVRRLMSRPTPAWPVRNKRALS